MVVSGASGRDDGTTGRALLRLRLLEGQVHCYVQHGRPGPLHLALMAPENLRIADTEKRHANTLSIARR